MKVLIVSSYELGHQPFHAASAAAALREAGHRVRIVDLSLASLTAERLFWAEGVAFAVPMHTAMRIAVQALDEWRRHLEGREVCLFGLYASVGDLPEGVVTISGEYEDELVAWASGATRIDESSTRRGVVRQVPDRSDLAGLGRYVGVELVGERRLAASVTASRGCLHSCRHCPIPAVYGGKLRIVDRAVVLRDIDAQVELGAEHVSFADPDFLNGPVHSLRVLEAARRRHPDLTFDVTVKVEHILKYRHLLSRLSDLGVVFVVSAFESTNDRILEYLDKGHTRDDAAVATHLLRGNAIDVRPTWLPFTPWTKSQDLLDMLLFMERHDLDVDPIQLTIRLLIPRGSLLLDLPESILKTGPYRPESLSYSWASRDPGLDELQARLEARYGELSDGDPVTARNELTDMILAYCGAAAGSVRLADGEGRPRLTEPWFC